MIHRPTILAAVAAVALLVVPFASAMEKSGAEPHTVALGLAGYSPVSYFTDAGPHYGSPEFSAEHEGITYFFADAAERDSFNTDPAKYAPAYGGWCATGMALEKYFPVDPTTYKIVDDRLFLFLNNEEVNALDLWNDGDEAEQTDKADAYWAAENGS